MNELLTKNIEDMIYVIRGKQVMLDSDLAKLYGYSQGTKALNQAVKRNVERFPNRFYFQLTKEEYTNILRSQIVTLEINCNHHSKYLPYVFTEQGVAMLATILRTPTATQISIQIMDAFVLMRKYLSTNNYENRISNMETKLIDHDSKIDILFDKFNNDVENTKLFFEGQIYDAYSLLMDILSKSKDSIIIIDNYIDRKLLDVITKFNNVITVTKYINSKDIDKYNKQYDNLKIIINNSFHDRFIIIDKKILYHCGASFKDLGKKCFALTKLEDNKYLSDILKNII